MRIMRRLQWPTVGGYGLFVGMMAAGYYYNITFVQLGLPDLATRLISLPEVAVARSICEQEHHHGNCRSAWFVRRPARLG